MNGKVKNQHFVPQLYLRHFCAADDKLFVFDKPNEKVFKSPTDQVASSKYFYDIDASLLEDGTDSQIVEKELAKAESRYIQALGKTLTALEQRDTLAAETIPVLAEFMAVQAMRTREVRTHMEQMNKMLGMVLDQEGAAEAKAKYHMGETGFPFVQAMLMFGDGCKQTKSVLENHIWLGARNTSRRPFITSDNPIIRNPHIKNQYAPSTGLASSGIEIFLPINPRFGIILLERGFHGRFAERELQVIEMTEENIAFYNGHQVLQSDRQLFSNDGDFHGVREVLRDHPDVKNPKRQRAGFIWAGRQIDLDDTD